MARLPRKLRRSLLRQLFYSAILLVGLTILVRRHHFYSRRQSVPYHSTRSSSSSSSSSVPPQNAFVHPTLPLSLLSSIPRNIYYLTHEDVMYCYIPKNACSRFKPLLRKREHFTDWSNPHKIHGKNGLQRLKWLSYPRAVSRIRTFKKFIVIRDPFSRLVSAYQNKVATPWPDQRRDFWEKHLSKECPGMIHAMTMPTEGPLLSMEQFLKCLLSTDKTEPSNEHWRPQTELCALEYIQYDFVLHLEQLSEGVPDLMAYLNWNENITSFQMDRNPVYSRNLTDYFSEESLQLALRYYKKDFLLLDYPKEPKGTIDFYSVFDGSNFQPGFVPPIDFQPPNINK